MASYSTNEFKSGLKILLDGDPYAIVENEFVKPGKGQAFNRVRIRNLKTGRTLERTFKSGDTVEARRRRRNGHAVPLQRRRLLALHGARQLRAAHRRQGSDGRRGQWLKDGMTLHRDAVERRAAVGHAPAHVELKIVETDPGVRGDTATGGQKPAKLETGAVVRVPLFINEGEVIRVDTRTGEYISRAKS